MLSPKLERDLNDQINLEFESAYLYLGLSLDMQGAGYAGAASWMKAQYEEELSHAFRIMGHVQDRMGRVALQPIDAPGAPCESPLDAFRAALEHEKRVTDSINRLLRVAREEDDAACENLLSWFVDEQVEEEASGQAVVTRLEMAGSDTAALLMVDAELAGRASE